MSRQKIIRKVQKVADTAKTKINAAEVSRVSSMVLDEVEEGMQKLFNGIYWDFHNTKEGVSVANKVMALVHKLEALVERARRKSRATNHR